MRRNDKMNSPGVTTSHDLARLVIYRGERECSTVHGGGESRGQVGRRWVRT